MSERLEKFSLLNLSKCWLRDDLIIAFKYVLKGEIAHRLFFIQVANVASPLIYEKNEARNKKNKKGENK